MHKISAVVAFSKSMVIGRRSKLYLNSQHVNDAIHKRCVFSRLSRKTSEDKYLTVCDVTLITLYDKRKRNYSYRIKVT